MKWLIHWRSPLNRDFRGKMGISSSYPGRIGALHITIEVRDLPDCMHAGIGTTRPGNPDRNARNSLQRPFDTVLNSVSRGL